MKLIFVTSLSNFGLRLCVTKFTFCSIEKDGLPLLVLLFLVSLIKAIKIDLVLEN